MSAFDQDRYYVTNDPELLLLGTPGALAQWRTRGEGPRYHKIGRRILYKGDALNQFLEACAIEPTVRRDASEGSLPESGSRGASPSPPDGAPGASRAVIST